MKKLLVSWSSGKDSAWMLHLLRAQRVEIVGLVTTVNEAFDRVAMHGVRRVLVEAQAKAAGIPLWPVALPWPCSNQQYERIMGEVCSRAVEMGVDTMAFGDLFLEDIRQYRERQLQGTGLTPVFPLWKMPTEALAREMIAGGLRAKITCVDPKALAPGFAGRDFDLALLAELPPNIDPCGENGEFHSFVCDGPMFQRPVAVSVGETCERDGFVFADLLPIE